VELVVSLGGDQETSAAIVNLQRRHLIDDPNRAELNPLVRAYVYRALGADAKRRRLHRLAGDWYAEIPAAALSAATHYAEADLLDETVETIAHGEKGIIARGEASAAVAVLDRAAAQAEARRGLGGDSLRRLLTIRGALLSASARSAEAEANLRQALSLATNPAIRADLVYRLSLVMAQHGRFAEALELIETVRAELPPADLLLSAQLAVADARICDVNGDHTRARANAEEAIRLANQVAHISPSHAEEIRAEAYYSLANVARRSRQVDVAIEYAQCSLASAHRSGQSIREVACLSFIGGMLYDSGDLDGSLRYRRDALAGAQAIEDQVGVGYYLTHLADIDYLQLHPVEALKKLDLAIPILNDTGEVRGLASALALSAKSHLLLGNLGSAEKAILRVIDAMEGPATRRSWGAYLDRYATIQMVQGKVAAAWATLERALKLGAVADDRMLHFELDTNFAFLQALDGHPDEARATLAQSQRIDGLSLWVELDRDLVDACVLLIAGDFDAAAHTAHRIELETRACPLYHHRAKRLISAVSDRRPSSELPSILWVGID
jgi:tetratricopeptide (TPR) repeat protein